LLGLKGTVGEEAEKANKVLTGQKSGRRVAGRRSEERKEIHTTRPQSWGRKEGEDAIIKKEKRQM